VLHSFTGYSDGATPNARLTIDHNGALYGAAFSGGILPTNCTGGYDGYAPGCGVVFQLAPPAGPGGVWSSGRQVVRHDPGFRVPIEAARIARRRMERGDHI